MKKIPEGWKNGFLGKYVTEIKERFNGDAETPVLSVTNSQGFVLSEEYFDRQVFSKNRENYKVVRCGQFAYNPSRLNVGSLARLNTWKRGLLSPMYVVFEANKSINSTFLEYWLRSGKVRSLISVSTQGTVRDSVSFSTLAGFPISLPPLPEQEKIAEILGSVDAAIDATRRVIEQTRTLKRALMQQLLTRGIPGRHKRFKLSPLGEIPEEWEVVKLREIAVIQTGIAKNGKIKNGHSIKVPYLRVANVQDGYVDLSEMKDIEISEDKLKRYLLKRRDVLFNEGGDADKLGRGCVWEGQIDPCVHQNHVFVVRCGKQLNPYFLACQAGSQRGKQFFFHSSKQTTNLASINTSQLKEFPVFLPDINEQKSIIRALDGTDIRINNEIKTIEILQSVKFALMQALLSGDTRIPAKALKRKEVI